MIVFSEHKCSQWSLDALNYGSIVWFLNCTYSTGFYRFLFHVGDVDAFYCVHM